MIHDIFLTYANYSLRKHPKKLLDMLFVLRELGIENLSQYWDDFIWIVRYFVAFVRIDDLERAREITYKLNLRGLRFSMECGWRIAYEGVYGYRDGFCEKECDQHSEMKQIYGDGIFSKPGELKCYECYQFYFRSLLTGITEGKKYSEIGFYGLNHLIINARLDLNKFVDIVPSHTGTSDEVLEERLSFIPRYASFIDSDDRGGLAFRRLFFDFMVGFSLTEFLLNNDRRKIKNCPYCKKFFIAKDVKRVRCYSRECEKEYRRLQKQRQREENPLKYI
jgi:hypothetical protein